VSLLRVKNLTVDFSSAHSFVRVLHGVNLQVDYGQVLGLVGETGSGKSMTAYSILQLLPASGRITSGEIWLEEKNLLGLGKKEIHKYRGKSVAMIFQQPRASLNPVFTIGQQLSLVFKSHYGGSRQEVYHKLIEILRQVEIPDPEVRLKSYPHELSGGMCQRVLIAQALICSPRLLLADEPTTGLDVTVQAEILELLKNVVHTTGSSMIFITHDLGVVANLCDRVAVMYAGRVVEEGPVPEVFRNPLHPYTRGLLASVLRADIDNEIVRMHGSNPDPGNFPAGCAFHLRCPLADGLCKSEIPAVKQLDNNRTIYCHHWR